MLTTVHDPLSPWAAAAEARSLEPVLHSKRSHRSEKPEHHNKKQHSSQLENARAKQRSFSEGKNNNITKIK